MRQLDGITDSMDLSLSQLWEIVKGILAYCIRGITESWTIKKLSAEKLVLLNCGAGEDS